MRSAFFAALAKSLVTVKRKTTRSLDLAMHTTFGDGRLPYRGDREIHVAWA